MDKEKEKIVFLPGLNGIRTIAALGVMVSHITLALGALDLDISLFGYKNGNISAWALGEHGVTMFFVLSGFLITFLLLKEKEKYKEINVKSFYMRRILRIWPLYYVYLVICLALYVLLYDGNVVCGTTLLYVFFLANIPFILETTLFCLEHLWSIGVEEWFYIFWPFLFKLKMGG